MGKINYKSLQISTSDPKKWYIYYVLILDDGSTEKRKEFGKIYQISLNKIKDHKERLQKATLLMGLVQKDLEQGIDPKYRMVAIDNRNKQKLEEARKIEDAKISIDEGIELLRREKGWINPDSTKKHAANVISTFLKNSFKTYLIKIGKDDDLRKVKRMDIVNFIEENFNRDTVITKNNKGNNIKKTGWSSSTSGINKTRISLLFSTLINLGLVEENPTNGVKIKSDAEKLDKSEVNDIDVHEAWTVEESAEFFKILKESKDKIEQIFFVSGACLFYAAVRKSELLRLKLSHFDFTNNLILMPSKITKSARKYKKNEIIHIDITPKFKSIVEPYIRSMYSKGFDKEDYLFFQEDSKKEYNYATYNKHWEKLRERLIDLTGGKYFEGKSQYALKHTGTIALYNALVNAGKTPAELQRIIQKHCRHSDWSQTEEYLRDKCKIVIQQNREIIDF